MPCFRLFAFAGKAEGSVLKLETKPTNQDLPKAYLTLSAASETSVNGQCEKMEEKAK